MPPVNVPLSKTPRITYKIPKIKEKKEESLYEYLRYHLRSSTDAQPELVAKLVSLLVFRKIISTNDIKLLLPIDDVTKTISILLPTNEGGK